MKGFNRIEYVGIIFETILEECSEVKDDTLMFINQEADALVFVNRELNINFEAWLDWKQQWVEGLHGGDCTKSACTCPVCYWSEILENGSRITLALDREEIGYWSGESLLEKALSGEDGPATSFWTSMAEKLRFEVETRGLLRSDILKNR